MQQGWVKKQEYQKQYHENEKTPIQFESGHKMYIKNFSGSGPRWLPGTVSRCVGKVFYEVSTEEGGTMMRHKNQLRPRTELTAVLQDTGLATSPGREDEGEHEVLEDVVGREMDGDKEAIEVEVERDLEGERQQKTGMSCLSLQRRSRPLMKSNIGTQEGIGDHRIIITVEVM